MSKPGSSLTLCLLPGLDGTGRLYRRLISALTPGFDVRVLDYPGQTIDGYPELAESMIRRLPIDGPYVLVAESFAGPLAVLLAAANPPGLRGLVIAASFLCNPVCQSNALARVLHHFPSNMSPPLAMLEAVLMGSWKDSHVKQELEASLRSVAPHVLKSRLMAAMRVDVTKQFDRIHKPVLYLRATRDRLLRNGVARDFAAAKRPPTLMELEAPHFIFQAVAPQAAQSIRTFIADNGVSSH